MNVNSNPLKLRGPKFVKMLQKQADQIAAGKPLNHGPYIIGHKKKDVKEHDLAWRPNTGLGGGVPMGDGNLMTSKGPMTAAQLHSGQYLDAAFVGDDGNGNSWIMTKKGPVLLEGYTPGQYMQGLA